MATRSAGLLALLTASILYSPLDASGSEVLERRAAAEAGRRIYETGRLPSGRPVQATVQGDVPITGEAARCSGCHGRSGLGYAEGLEVPLSIAGRTLFRPRRIERTELYTYGMEGPRTRPAYDAESLARVIRTGLDPVGRSLDPLMPRYELEDTGLEALIAYLATLSPSEAPGVTNTELHLATVVTGNVEAGRRTAMLAVLDHYVRDKNSGTRHEQARARVRALHKEWDYRAYRTWRLHTWELAGDRETWANQLDALYRDQPVFALVSGLGAGSWQPVHEFCERHKVPCVLPNTSLPVISETDFYSIYYSEGVVLEARVLAKFIGEARKPGGARGGRSSILQVHAGDERGKVGAETFRRSLLEFGPASVAEMDLATEEAPSAALEAVLGAPDGPEAVVIWLEERYAEPIRTALAQARPVDVYAPSYSPLARDADSLPPSVRARIRVAHPFVTEDRLSRRFLRTGAWLRRKGIDGSLPTLKANTYFAARVLGDAIMHISGNFSREHLMEKIEHRMESAAASSLYPSPSLGAGQRYASKGAYVAEVGAAGKEGARLVPISAWIIP